MGMKIENYLFEEWRDINGYEGMYQVSNYGRVRSLARKTGNQYGKNTRILKQKKQKLGYMSVGLYKDGKQKYYLIHRLVAQAFIPNPNNYPQVNHKDENKENNFVWVNEDGTVNLEKSNLEWCSAQYNSNYGSHIKTYDRAINKPNRPDTSKPVLQYSLDGKPLNEYPSIMEAQRQTGIKNTHIGRCCRNEYGCKTAGGFKWRYAS